MQLGFILGILILVFWFLYNLSFARFGAPYVAMDPEVIKAVMKLADIKKGEIFYDLGSGDGRLVIAAALKGARAYGIEINSLRVFYSRLWIRLLRLGKNAEIIHDNFFNVNLSATDIVCVFLLQSTNQLLKEKFWQELKPGTRIISYGFTFEGWQPEKSILADATFGFVLLYRR
ncbi:MAG TPA: SAM-dependent methyltransferase [Candidatus Bathyarchaeia archaeon]|nr:SAM-dependent methyltransferase [Candidatus Bathyarchaeia archaeon]